MYNSNYFYFDNYNHPTRYADNNHSLIDHVALNFREDIDPSIESTSLSYQDI